MSSLTYPNTNVALHRRRAVTRAHLAVKLMQDVHKLLEREDAEGIGRLNHLIWWDLDMELSGLCTV